jgi:hypothetical protein
MCQWKTEWRDVIGVKRGAIEDGVPIIVSADVDGSQLNARLSPSDARKLAEQLCALAYEVVPLREKDATMSGIPDPRTCSDFAPILSGVVRLRELVDLWKRGRMTKAGLPCSDVIAEVEACFDADYKTCSTCAFENAPTRDGECVFRRTETRQCWYPKEQPAVSAADLAMLKNLAEGDGSVAVFSRAILAVLKGGDR